MKKSFEVMYSVDSDGAGIVKPNEKVIEETDITILFDYPLNNPTKLKFHSKNGFTRKKFWKVVHDGYTKIYAQEEKDDKDPGMIPGMYNRAPSQGRYGIWGHSIGDLYLVNAECVRGIWHLGIDS